MLRYAYFLPLTAMLITPSAQADITIDPLNNGHNNVFPAVITNGTPIIIGNTLPGHLRIDSQGSLTTLNTLTHDTTIGVIPSVSGTLTVSGNSAQFVTSNLKLGLQGSGLVQLNQEASLITTQNTTLGEFTNSLGEFNLSSQASFITNLLAIGGHGEGIFNINTQASAAAINTFLAFQLGSKGALNVADSGTLFSTTNLFVGGQGTATLSIQRNAQLQVNGAYSQNANSGLDFHLTQDYLTTAGNQFAITGNLDQLETINQGLLSASLNGSINVTPDTGLIPFYDNQTYNLIQVKGSDPSAITGTFAGLPQGATVTNINGFDLKISYTGGDGNDVILYTPDNPNLDFIGDVQTDPNRYFIGINELGELQLRNNTSLNTQTLIVSHNAQGTLDIDHASFDAQTAILANNANTNATAKITNNGSLTTHELIIGSKGQAELNVADGASVTAQTTQLGKTLGSKGTLNLLSNATLHTHDLSLGLSSDSVINIKSGGQLQIDNSFKHLQAATLNTTLSKHYLASDGNKFAITGNTQAAETSQQGVSSLLIDQGLFEFEYPTTGNLNTSHYDLFENQTYKLIQVKGTAPTNNTFHNLPQDAIVETIYGIDIKISYTGGDGNDIILYTPEYETLQRNDGVAMNPKAIIVGQGQAGQLDIHDDFHFTPVTFEAGITHQGTINLSNQAKVSAAFLTIAKTDDASLNLSGGAKINATSFADFSQSESATAHINLTGENTKITAQSTNIGYLGEAVLNISDSAKFDIKNLAYIGYGPTSDATINISGANSNFSAQTVRLAHYGKATLNISDAGTFSTTNAGSEEAYFSFHEGSESTINLSGENSRLMTASVRIANAGKNITRITQGGAFHASSDVVAAYSGSADAEIYIQDAGSSLQAYNFTLGAYGTAQLDIQNGAQARIKALYKQNNKSTLRLTLSDHYLALAEESLFAITYDSAAASPLEQGVREVDLDGNLEIRLADLHTLEHNQVYKILQIAGNSAESLTGSLKNLAQGALVDTLDGTKVYISYTGGDGNDIILFTHHLGDTNQDLLVNESDLENLKASFGTGLADGDANQDGVTDLNDLATIRNHYHARPHATAIPEPSSLMLLILTSVIMTRARRE